MRILVLGAGAIGGYYGGRMAAAGVDVTFLVRPRRAEQLRERGLTIRSPLGDVTTPVKTVLAEELKPGWDAIILPCKAFGLDEAIAAIRPAAPGALIVPQLNGMRHLDVLDAEFGADNVTGGSTLISVALDAEGTVHHYSRFHGFVQGPRAPSQRARCEALHAELQKGGFTAVLSDNVLLDMWEKFSFICALAGICCLMRGNVAQIARTNEGAALALEIFGECTAVSEAAGYLPRTRFVEASRARMTDTEGDFAASMLRDVQNGRPTEADHIVGDMLARAHAAGHPAPLLRAAYSHLQVYEAQRK